MGEEVEFRKKWTTEDANKSLTDVSIIINLLADLSPAGILPLSYGMIGTGYAPSMIILLLFTAAAGYVMYLISRFMDRVMIQYGTGHWESFDRLWTTVVGKSTSWIPVVTVASVTFGCCLAYACMFGDLFAGCMPAFGITFASRTVCLIVLSVPLLPLCCMKDLSLLAPTSFAALVAVIYTLVMMVIRYSDGSYAPGGEYFTKAPPPAGDHTWTLGASSLLLVNGLAVAFLCHYNGCKYYREYVTAIPGVFGRRIALAFSAVSLMFAVAMMVGYATFGAFSDGVILNSYAANDMLANAARVGMGFANVCSFPLMFSGLREQSMALICFMSPSMQETTELVSFQNIFSGVMLVIITIIAIIVTDASLVVGLVGSICGSATIYVIPCFIMDRAFTAGGIQAGSAEDVEN
jgi:amino acid permease